MIFEDFFSESLIMQCYYIGEFQDVESIRNFVKRISESKLRKIVRDASQSGYTNSYLLGYKTIGEDENDNRIKHIIPTIYTLSKEELESELVDVIVTVIKNHNNSIEEKKIEKEIKKSVYLESSNNALNIEPDEFMNETKIIIETLYKNRKIFTEAFIPCYCSDNTIYYAALYKNDKLMNIGITDDLTKWVSYRLKTYIEGNNAEEYSISYIHRLNKNAKDYDAAIAIITGIKRAVIPDDSSVFITSQKLSSYISNVHGLTNAMIQKFLKNNPNIIQYSNMGTLIYSKKDVDCRVIRDAKAGLFQK